MKFISFWFMMHKLNLSVCFILLPLVLSTMSCPFDAAIFNSFVQCSQDANITAITSSNKYITLGNLLNSLAANGPLNGGFYNTSAGNGTDKLYGLVQCRGDTPYSNCSACTKDAARIALEGCTDPTGAATMVWKPTCFIRYSHLDFFGTLDIHDFIGWSQNDTDLQEPVNMTEGQNLMSKIAGRTPAQPLMFYAAESGTMHGMAQCTRDLSKADCGMCLENMVANHTSSLMNNRDWVIYGASCSLWYHNNALFVNASSSSSPSPPSASPPASSTPASASPTSAGNTVIYSALRVPISVFSSVVFLVLSL